MLESSIFVTYRYGFFASLYSCCLSVLDSLRGLVFYAVCCLQHLFGDRFSTWLLGFLYRKFQVLDTAEPRFSSRKYPSLCSYRLHPNVVLASGIGAVLLKGYVLSMEAVREDMDKREASLIYALFKHQPAILKDLIFSYPKLLDYMLCDFRRGNNAFWCAKDARVLSCVFSHYLTCGDLVDDVKKKAGFIRAWGRCVGLDMMLAQMSLVGTGGGRLFAFSYLNRSAASDGSAPNSLPCARALKIYDLMSRIQDIGFWSMLCDLYPEIEASVMDDVRNGQHAAPDASLSIVFQLLIKRGTMSYEDIKKDAAYGDRSYVVRLVRFDPVFLFKYSGYRILLSRLSLNGRTDPCYMASRRALMRACAHAVIEDMGLYPHSVTYLLLSGFSKEDWRNILISFPEVAQLLCDDFSKGSAARWCYVTQDVLSALMETRCLSKDNIQRDLSRQEQSCMAGWRRVFGPESYARLQAEYVSGGALEEASSALCVVSK